MVKVIVSPFLKKFCDQQAEFFIEAKTIRELKAVLFSSYKSLTKVIFTEENQLNGFVNLYLDNERIDIAKGAIKLPEGSTVEILVSISGG